MVLKVLLQHLAVHGVSWCVAGAPGGYGSHTAQNAPLNWFQWARDAGLVLGSSCKRKTGCAGSGREAV